MQSGPYENDLVEYNSKSQEHKKQEHHEGE